jgi:peptidoglycan/xylan/chitin deacetylase (PgdA/CDA1 family)
MTVLALMYHQARPGPGGNDPAALDAHFGRIADAHRCVLPGEPLDPGRLNVCLTFDDAYFDFYAVVFPLLEKHGLRALLAVPPAVVPEKASAPRAARLSAVGALGDGAYDPDGLCTWGELGEMARSGRVAFGAHGYTHCRVDLPGVDLEREVVLPRELLASRLGRPVESFVFPYGRFSRAALRKVRQHYRYAFRIGEADNAGWGGAMLYRVRADGLASPDAPFALHRRAGYRARRYWCQLRGR